MNLGQLFAEQISIKLTSNLNIRETKLRRYLNLWAEDIYNIVMSMQRDERLNHYIYQLPNGDGVLEFNLDLDTAELDIQFQDKNHLKFQQKFKSMLTHVYNDIAAEKTNKRDVKFASVDEVDQFFENM